MYLSPISSSGYRVLIVLAAIFSGGCQKYLPDPGLTGLIETGSSIKVVNSTITTSGGTVKVSQTGSPLNGLELVIPPSSFSSDQNIEIACSEIQSHDLGEFFNPVTPLISITTEELYSNHPMELKIPVSLEDGQFGVAYLFNPDDGELEALPTISEGDGYLTVSSMHFSSEATTLKSGSEGNTDHDYRIVVGSASKAAISAQSEIRSGFEPGIDDWEFVNYGSYLAREGHCAGQSATAIWYYVRNKKSMGSLFHKYDRNISEARPDTRWMDNPRGYRFSSVIQSEMYFDNWIETIKKQMEKPELFWRNLAQAMRIKNRPQLLFICNSAEKKGHAVICYKIDLANKRVYVADPNYPGNQSKSFGYTDHWTGPYSSQYMAGLPDVSFDLIGAVQISQFIPVRRINERWKEFEANTIGNDLFPAYHLHLGTPAGPELTDGMSVNSSELKVVSRSDQCEGFIGGTDKLQPLSIYSKTGDLLYQYNPADLGVGTCKVEPGENEVGILINGLNSKSNMYFVDFKWIKINCTKIELSFSPSLIYTVAGQTCLLTATSSGTLPSDYKTVWSFGDKTGEVTVNNGLSADHIYTEDGGYPVVCSLYDKASNTLLAKANATVWVIPALLSDLVSTRSLFISFDAYMAADNGTLVNPFLVNDEYRNHLKQNLSWNGTAFLINFRYPKPGNGTDSLIVTGTLEGLASSDGQKIESLKATQRQEFKSGTGYWRTDEITMKDIPLIINDAFGVKYGANGPSVKDHIVEIKISMNRFNTTAGEYQVINLQSIDYTLSPYPQLRVDFYH